MALYTFQRDEGRYFYLYTFRKFEWAVGPYSTFKTFKSSAFVIAMLLAVPIMNKVLGWRDTVGGRGALCLPSLTHSLSLCRLSSL